MDASNSPNPLRPYYIPPTIGERTNLPALPSGVPNATRVPSSGTSIPQGFSRFDYSDLVSDGATSAGEVAKRWLNGALMGYAGALLFQPFVVGTTILQVQLNRASQVPKKTSKRRSTRSRRYSDSVR